MVFASLIDRYAWLRKIRVSEGADGNGHHVWDSIRQIEDSGAALRAEVKPSRGSLVADAYIL